CASLTPGGIDSSPIDYW
nr:immunoglobulin heavy chain junction region [Macaca mulatta]MOW93925.1 immunoglobulin heavy chain junction region [Macaca mulatta]MOW94234.1 immunoglobulin heavy chain junction region [Macaca mulatta]MOW94793.1 immunoglobulin heavy chain junction region [Macaca mulatta]MOW95510.1 immunoglobulin heavy chain junction region [Macaca mulatta]